MELIRLENITKTYHLGEVDVPVLKGISLSIQRGEMVALMGASGSGKTTLMNILGCLDRPSSGQYWLDGQEMSRLTPNQRALVRTAKLGFVFQSFNLLPRTSAIHNVFMPLDYSPHRPHGGDARRRARQHLDLVGLADRVDHEPSQMSGGQQQRVAIARALINRPALVLADEPTGNLDSHTSVEILRMFQKLNSEGITVILVTHDASVASYAHRTIRIVDGQMAGDGARAAAVHGSLLASDARRGWPPLSLPIVGNGDGAAMLVARRRVASPAPAEGPNAAALESLGMRVDQAVAEPGASHVQPMGEVAQAIPRSAQSPAERPKVAAFPIIPSTLRTALRSLRRNKMRSILTALGVIIGVGAVIAMTEIGQGSKIAVQKTIATMGANNLLVLPGAAMTGSVSFGVGTSQTLRPSDMDEILKQCPAVSEVAAFVWARGQVIYGNHNWVPKSLFGTTPSYLVVREWELEEGDAFTDHDVRTNSKVCMLGDTVRQELFGDMSPLGEDVRIQNVPFRVVGVLKRKGANMLGQDQDDIVVAPWTTIKLRINGSGAGSTVQTTATQAALGAINSLNNLYPAATALYPVPAPAELVDTPQSVRFINLDMLIAKAVSNEQIPTAMDQITSLLRERHRLPKQRDNDFDIRDLTEVSKTMASASELMGALLLVVAAISLIVGGVGIMNIMLVSVTERTREIGLRMAVGARSHHILRQFLVEAVLLCLVGGALGIGVGRLTSVIVRSVKHWPTQASLSAIVVAVLVSVGVGVVFGFYPAWKASRLDPIEALRYE